jgi:hypothetical protein
MIDIALPKPRREFLKKKVSNTVGQSFGTAFLEQRRRHNQFAFLNKIL